MLAPQHIEELLEVIANTDNNPFAQTYDTLLQTSAPTWALHSTLALLVEDGQFNPAQRLVALYSLSSSNQHDMPNNVWLPFLLDLLDNLKHHSPQERAFVIHLLSGNSEEISPLSPIQFLSSAMNPPNEPSLDYLRQIMMERIETCHDTMAQLKQSMDILSVVPDHSNTKIDSNAASRNQIDDIQRELALQAFRPKYCRPLPPAYPVDDQGVMWLNLDQSPKFVWDYAMSTEMLSGSGELEQLLRIAVQRTLNLGEDAKLSELLESESFEEGVLVAKDLPDLVENNPKIAIEVLLKLMRSDNITTEYLTVLVNMNMSLHSMEVVNKLTSTVDLPQDFIHLYITNCISTCENMTEKQMQTRNVRLVCVFLQSLIRNNILQIDDLFIELQAFCIEFSRIREAAALFRLLKDIDNSSTA